MKKEKTTAEDLKIIINGEGIGYAIQNYVGHEDIKDKELARLWKRAKKLLDLIEEKISEKVVEGVG